MSNDQKSKPTKLGTCRCDTRPGDTFQHDGADCCMECGLPVGKREPPTPTTMPWPQALRRALPWSAFILVPFLIWALS